MSLQSLIDDLKELHCEAGSIKCKCWVIGCDNSSDVERAATFFSYPKKWPKSVLKKWREALNRPDNKILEKSYICDKHFDENSIIVNNDVIRYLKKNSIPTVNLTPSNNSDVPILIRYREMSKKIEATKVLTAESKKQLLTLPRMLKLYTYSPEIYNVLHSILDFPTPSSLPSVFDQYNFKLQKSSLYYEFLYFKVSLMTPVETKCFISFEIIDVTSAMSYDCDIDILYGVETLSQDSIALKPVSKCLVLYAHGLLSKWSLPIDITFYKEDDNTIDKIQVWIQKTCVKLKEIGLNILALVYPLLQKHIEQDTDKYPMLYVKDVINYIYPIQLLFKTFCFNLLKYDCSFNSGKALKTHMHEYYAVDRKDNLATSYLTYHYFNSQINDYTELSKQYLDLFFNGQIASAMLTYISLNMLNVSAKITASLIQDMSVLYNIFDLNRAQNMTLNEEHTIIRRIILILKDMIFFYPGTKNFVNGDMFISNFMLTLQSYMYLTKLRPSKKNLIKKRLFNDCITNNINDDLDNEMHSSQFVSKMFISKLKENYMVPLCSQIKESKKVDLTFAIDEFNKHGYWLKQFYFYTSLNINPNIKKMYKNFPNIINMYNILPKEGNDYIIGTAGFILKKCLEEHSCVIFKNYVTYIDEEVAKLCINIEEHVKNDICLMPQENFIDYIEIMEIKFLSIISEESFSISGEGIARDIVNKMTNIGFTSPCPCFPFKYSKYLFVLIRLYLYCKETNSARNVFDNAYPDYCDPLSGLS